MTDADFVEELVTRLNLVLEADSQRGGAALSTPLMHAGYANVAHFVGQLAMPRGINRDSSAEEVLNVKFVTPTVQDGRITRFEAVSGEELQRRHEKAAAAQAPDLE